MNDRQKTFKKNVQNKQSASVQKMITILFIPRFFVFKCMKRSVFVFNLPSSDQTVRNVVSKSF